MYQARTGISARRDLCTGCGTCQAMCPVNAIEMQLQPGKGIYLPVINNHKCTNCGMCLKACPGQKVDFKRLNLAIFGRQLDENPPGTLINCFVGQAADYDIRFNSSSGGLATALLLFALEEKIISGALVTRMKKDNPLEPEPFIARTREEIIEASRSKYCPVAANTALKEIMQAGEGEKLAVVGLPCHIQGIRKAESLNAELRKRIVLHFGLACSHTLSFEATEYILRNHGICKEDIARLDYRGQGWPGQMTLLLKNGTSKQIPYVENIKMHGYYFFTPLRCALCGDFTNRFADITFMDAWLPEIINREKTGKSIIIVRSGPGERVCRSACSQKIVELDSLPLSELIRSQDNGRITNKYLKAYSDLIKLSGSPVPDYNLTIPRSKLVFYLHAIVMIFNIRISTNRYLKGFTKPLYFFESRLVRRLMAR
jgi:coenzyme F420 hydrogenase subunit beta